MIVDLGVLAAFGSSVTWAYASTRYAQASRDVGSQRVNLARALTVFPIYTAFAFILGGAHAFDGITPGRAGWLMMSMLCSYAVGDNLFFTAARRIGISTAMAIASTYPLWAALAGVLYGGEPFGPGRAAGTLLCVGGVAALVRLAPGAKGERTKREGSRPSPSPDGARKGDTLGIVLALVTSVLWAGNSFSTQRGGAGLDVAPVNAIRYGVALLLLYGQIAIMRTPPPRPRPAGGWLALAPAIFADAIFGSVFYVYGLTHTDLAIGATLSSMAPLVSLPLAIFWGEERWNLARSLAVVTTVAGVALLVLSAAR